MNNYEKIKAMSLDEMAEYFSTYCYCDYDGCPIYQFCQTNDNDCPVSIKQWLEKECEEQTDEK